MANVTNSPFYQKILQNIDQLPALPTIVSRLVSVVNSPDSSAGDAAKLIEKDPILTSKMLRLANSAFYGMPRAVSSVSSAVVILGFNTIKSLVLGSAVMKIFPLKNRVIAFERERFWKHSIVTGLAARAITRYYLNVRLIDPESAFCAGILHDLGKLVFEQFLPQEYGRIAEYARQNNLPLILVEGEVLGINHADVGRIVADSWALPLDLEYAMVYHHAPSLADNLTELVATIHLADSIAHEVHSDLWEKEPMSQFWNKTTGVLAMKPDDREKIVAQVQAEIQKADEYFSIING